MSKKLLMNNNWIRINAVNGVIPLTDIQVNTGDVYDARNVGSSYRFYDAKINLYEVTADKAGYIRISGHYNTGQKFYGDALIADYVIYKLTKTN